MGSRKHSILVTVCVAIIAAALASALTALYMMGGLGGSNSPQQKYARLETIRNVLQKEYYREIDDEVLFNGALKGMLMSLDDPYSYYITPEEAQARIETESKVYYGLGMTVTMTEEGVLEVVDVNGGKAADIGGILPGDRIVAVDGVSLAGKTLDEAVELVRAEETGYVVLEIEREGEQLTLELTRMEIPVSNISAAMMDDMIGYIRIEQFAGTDVPDFTDALEELRTEGARALIIDLRNNPGGYLDHVTKIADMLLPEALMVYTQDRNEKRVDYYSDAEYCDLPLCVLVNGNSASASEIFTAAMKDNGRAIVIGTKTYGKGIVQTVYSFEEDGAAMQFTSSTYYTPAGICIHGTGVEPDIAEEDPEKQLEIAIEQLKN